MRLFAAPPIALLPRRGFGGVVSVVVDILGCGVPMQMMLRVREFGAAEVRVSRTM